MAKVYVFTVDLIVYHDIKPQYWLSSLNTGQSRLTKSLSGRFDWSHHQNLTKLQEQVYINSSNSFSSVNLTQFAAFLSWEYGQIRVGLKIEIHEIHQNLRNLNGKWLPIL